MSDTPEQIRKDHMKFAADISARIQKTYDLECDIDLNTIVISQMSQEISDLRKEVADAQQQQQDKHLDDSLSNITLGSESFKEINSHAEGIRSWKVYGYGVLLRTAKLGSPPFWGWDFGSKIQEITSVNLLFVAAFIMKVEDTIHGKGHVQSIIDQ